jgi:hypothetical protein
MLSVKLARKSPGVSALTKCVYAIKRVTKMRKSDFIVMQIFGETS